MVNQYEFIGNGITYFGFFGIVASIFATVVIFRSYNRSPIRR